MNDEAIWNKHRDELTRYTSMLIGPDDAEDLVSTVVVRVLNRRRLTDLDDARSYLYRSVLNGQLILETSDTLTWTSRHEDR